MSKNSFIPVDQQLRAFFDAIPKPPADGEQFELDAAREGIETCKRILNALRAEAYARANVRLLLDVQTLITELNMAIQAVVIMEQQSRKGLHLPGEVRAG